MNDRRSGKSLVELTVVLTIVSSIMMLAGKTFAFLMRADVRGRQSVAHTTNVARLAKRFRRDVHAAESAVLFSMEKETSKRLRLSMPDGDLIEYRRDRKRMTAVVINGEQVRSREHYMMGDGEIQFEISKGPPEIVSLIFTVNPTKQKSSSAEALPKRSIRIDAMTGRHLRFTRSTTNNPAGPRRSDSQKKSSHKKAAK